MALFSDQGSTCVSDYHMHLLRFAFLTPVLFKVTVKLVLVWNGLGTDP